MAALLSSSPLPDTISEADAKSGDGQWILDQWIMDDP
jgi:hypothetical protein